MDPVPEQLADGSFHAQLFSKANQDPGEHIHLGPLPGLQILESRGLVLIGDAADGVLLAVDIALAQPDWRRL